MFLCLRAFKKLTEFVCRVDRKTCTLGDEIKRNAWGSMWFLIAAMCTASGRLFELCPQSRCSLLRLYGNLHFAIRCGNQWKKTFGFITWAHFEAIGQSHHKIRIFVSAPERAGAEYSEMHKVSHQKSTHVWNLNVRFLRKCCAEVFRMLKDPHHPLLWEATQ